jgi:hypothetical protein
VTTSQVNRLSSAGSSVLAAPAARQPALRARIAPAVVGLIGAATCAYGVTLPWLTTFNGLLSQSGWGTRNGTIVYTGAVAAAVLAASQLLRPHLATRWLLALAGFALAGFAGYLVIELYAVFSELDGMTFAAKGPGLYVVAAGSATIFATVFLPMPGAAAKASPGTIDTGSAPSRPTPLPRSAIGSPLRYPAAGLALVAGLAHVPVTPEHLREAPYIGVMFIVLTTACVLLAAALLIVDSVLVWSTLGVTTMVAVVAYAVSRTIGLPLMADDVGNWLEPLGIVSVVTETGCPPWLRSPSVGPWALPPLTSSTPPLTGAPDSES